MPHISASTGVTHRSRPFHPVISLVLIGLLLGTMLLLPSIPAFAATTEVTPATPTWGLLQETPSGTGSFVSGPGTPPLGSGSVRLTVNSTGGYLLGTNSFTGTRLADMTRLEYNTYRTSGSTSLAITLQFGVDYDPADALTGWQGRLVFEPFYTGTPIQTGTWQTWDALSGPASGTWWATGAPGNTLCPQANPCTWNEVLGNWPDLRIHPTLGGIGLKAGGGWAGGFDGNVDALTIGISGNETTFDFNPPVQCTTTCYVATNGNDLFGGTSPSDAKRTIPAAVAQVDTGGNVIVAAGTYTESVVITQSLTLQGTGIGQTILDGSSTSGVHGITINGGVNNLTIRDLSIQEFDVGIRRPSGAPNETILFQDIASNNNLSAGIAFENSNSATNITFRRVTANFNGLTGLGLGRGIMMQSMYKENIIVEDGVFIGNRISGIDLNDGTGGGAPAVRGVRIIGNTVSGTPNPNQVTDSGIAVLGLDTSSGSYENIVSGNTITMYGRFGIEIKGSTANGQLSGPNSFVIGNNRIVQGGGPFNGVGAAETRDIAGIAVGNINGAGIPNGIVVINNDIIGIQQNNQAFDVATGFGVSASGTNVQILHNIVSNSEVGIQMQAGFTGTQAILNDQYFGRDTTITTTGGIVSYNLLSGNTVGLRNVGVPTPFDARCNAWELPSGPSALINPGGTGQPLSGTVVFAPWLISNADGDVDARGYQFPATISLTPPGDLSPADNDYRRIANAIGCVQSGQTITFSGNFDWRAPQSLASWALGNDAVSGTGDDNSSLVPANVDQVTLTAASLGSATIQGPGDLPDANREGFLVFDGGPNQNWTISNLQINEFDLGIGMFFGAGGTAAFSGTTITNNEILVATDVVSDVNQNIGIHYAFGVNQTISNNLIRFAGNGLSNTSGNQRATSVGVQSNTSGGSVYEGLRISGNTLQVIHAPSADPEVILGIWENGHAHTSNITVSSNLFENLAVGNDPALNLQRAFRITSHSGVASTVLYATNIVSGANIGFQWISGSDFSSLQPVLMQGNTVSNANTAVLVQSNGRATFSNTTINGGIAGFQLEGVSTTITLGNTAFNGQTGDYIKLVNNPNDVDARNTTFEGRSGAQFNLAQSLAVQAQLTDKNDNSALGLVILTDPYLLVTAPASGLQFGEVAQNAVLPAGIPITITNPAGSSFAYDWSLNAPTWLVCTPASGSLAPGAGASVACQPRSTATPGVFSGTVSISSSTPGVSSSPQTVSSSFTVVPPPTEILPQLSLQSASGIEGNNSSTLIPVTATLNLAASTPVSCTFRTLDGTAISSGTAADFEPISAGVITFAPGITTQTFFIAVFGDLRGEPDETLSVSVTQISGVELAPGGGTATVTILNDDRYLQYMPLVVRPGAAGATVRGGLPLVPPGAPGRQHPLRSHQVPDSAAESRTRPAPHDRGAS